MPKRPDIFLRITSILEQARAGLARTVNSTQVVANWLIGREIVEEEQDGKQKAGYGQELIRSLAGKLQQRFGNGYSQTNLKLFRQFYRAYPQFLTSRTGHTLSDQLSGAPAIATASAAIRHTPCDESWGPGQFHPGLAWSLYRHLLRVTSPHARAFYEIEAIQQNWNARELERQINSMLFERLAKSRNKKGVMKLATKGQEIQQPADVFKDPVVIEFLGLPESHRLVETKLEEALISNLKDFLLELGKGFAFVARQERLTLEGDHFYVDLVFYHTVLKCYVLIDIKVRKLTHADIGQMQLYTNYYDQERLTPGDNPTLGLILCTDRNETAVRYTLGPGQKKIFTSRYQLHLPSEADLAAEIQRELALLTPPAAKRTRARKR